jgi:DNA-binding transcriptional LysR family regulator
MTDPLTALRKLGIARLEIGMLAVLDALLAERSVTRAAVRLGLSQPTVSNALSRLRRTLGDPLLVKVGRHVVPTDRGIELQQMLKRVIDDLATSGTRQDFDPASSDHQFRIAITDHAGIMLMPGVIRRLRHEAPRIRLQVLALGVPYAEAESDGPDLVIHWARSPPPDWHVRRLIEEQLVVVGSLSNPKLRGPLSLEQFLELDHATLMPEEGGFTSGIDKALAHRGLSRNVSVSLAHFATLPFVVAASDLVALFPRGLAELSARITPLAILEPPEPFRSFAISMSWHPRLHHSEKHAWLRQLCVDAARDVKKGHFAESAAVT